MPKIAAGKNGNPNNIILFNDEKSIAWIENLPEIHYYEDQSLIDPINTELYYLDTVDLEFDVDNESIKIVSSSSFNLFSSLLSLFL